LLELLVVIGIIGVLVGILAPALAWAMHGAKLTACQSNIGSLVKANQVYASENRGFFVLASEDMGSTDLKRWFGTREDPNSAFEPTGGSLSSYMPGLKIKACPLFEGANEDAGQDGAFEAGCGAYGYNDLYIGGSYGLYKDRREMAKDRSQRAQTLSARLDDLNGDVVMFADTAYFRDGEMMAYSFTHAPKWVPASSYGSPNPTTHFRHRGLASIGWADGHATAEEMTYSGDYSGTADLSAASVGDIGLGWFGQQYETLPDANYLFDRE
jgi:prepilin-type processing-associated H-X9-DG protein